MTKWRTNILLRVVEHEFICKSIHGIGSCDMQSNKGIYCWMASDMQWEIETNGHAHQRWFLSMAWHLGKCSVKIIWL
jgi:hypothetical protein